MQESTEFYTSKAVVAGHLVLYLILIAPFGTGMLLTHLFLLNLAGFILLVGPLIFIASKIFQPLFEISPSYIVHRSYSGKKTVIDDISDYELVTDPQHVYLRSEGKRSLLLEKMRFSKSEWDRLVTKLYSLPTKKRE